MDPFLQAAIDEARQGMKEGGIPIGSVIVHGGRILGRGHNRRVQKGSPTLHGEMDALENAGRLPAKVLRECTIYTTLSPCSMCSGAILLYGIPRVVLAENTTFRGEEDLLRDRGVDESGNQIGVYGRLGSRPLDKKAREAFYLRNGKLYTVNDAAKGYQRVGK